MKRIACMFTGRELDTLLAALRQRQDSLLAGEDPLHFIASEHGKPLTVQEIDYLCEYINCGGED